jgi:hypothetical protein
MNERFSKLLQECIVPAGQIEDYTKSTKLVIPDEKLDVAKFYELIIEECNRYAVQNWEHGHLLGQDLKIYFGIESVE